MTSTLESLTEDQKKAVTLFQKIEEQMFPAAVGKERFYLTTIGALIGSAIPEHVATLYLYLCAKPEYTTSDQRKALIRRMREALVKCVPLNGVPLVLEAIFEIAKVERPEDRDYSFSREHWKSGKENHERGMSWLRFLYKGDMDAIYANFDAHRDFYWISTDITYGLFHSDHTILSGLETEIVVFAAIMSQNVPNETAWHLRAARRVGITLDDVEKLQQVVEEVAGFAGKKLDRICRVVDIEHQV